MAQSFQAGVVSLGEAERTKDGKPWTQADYDKHVERGFKVKQDDTHLNIVIKSADGKNKDQLVDNYFINKMLEQNRIKKAEVTKWNKEHRGQTNPKTGKKYHMKSVDKRKMYPVGEYKETGKRKLPHETLKSYIDQGIAIGKNSNKQYRKGIMQQFVVGFGNHDEWQNDKIRKKLLNLIHNEKNPKNQEFATKLFKEAYVDPYLDQFKKENPSMHIMQAVIQFDEPQPHLHLTVLPQYDKQTRNGLGSVSYTQAIANDHPDWQKNGIVKTFYRNQHENLKKIIKEAKPFKNISMNGKPMAIRYDSMTLAPAKPRKEQSFENVNHFNKFQENKINDIKWAAKKQYEIEKRAHELKEKQKQLDEKDRKLKSDQDDLDTKRNQVKTDLVDTIKLYSPNHTMDKQHLKPNEEPAIISSAKGFEQHQRQKISLIRLILQKVLELFKQENKKLVQQSKERETKAKKQEEANERAKEEAQREINTQIDDLSNQRDDLNQQTTKLTKLRKTLKIQQNEIDTETQKQKEFEDQLTKDFSTLLGSTNEKSMRRLAQGKTGIEAYGKGLKGYGLLYKIASEKLRSTDRYQRSRARQVMGSQAGKYQEKRDEGPDL